MAENMIPVAWKYTKRFTNFRRITVGRTDWLLDRGAEDALGRGDMLQDRNVAARIPAQNLQRARSFYSSKLGLDPIEERPGGLLYRCGSGHFALYQSAGLPSGAHTQMAWRGDYFEGTGKERGRSRGLF